MVFGFAVVLPVVEVVVESLLASLPAAGYCGRRNNGPCVEFQKDQRFSPLHEE